MNENLRNVIISIILCLFIIFGYLQRENMWEQQYLITQQSRRPPRFVGNEKPCTSSRCISKHLNCPCDINKTSARPGTRSDNTTALDKASLLDYLRDNLTSYFDEKKNKRPKPAICPAENSHKWDFNCVSHCPDMPHLSATSDRAQVCIRCKNKPTIKLENVKQVTPIQSFPENSECISEFVMQSCYDGNPVPSLVHYIWFSKKEMNFYHFLSFLSASKFLKPCLIMVHGDYLPIGFYWDYLLNLVPNIIHMKRNPPEAVFGIPLGNIEHKADVGRIQALQRFGGIYMDTDEIILRSLDNLRKYPFTLSHAVDHNLSNGLILSEKNAAFLSKWFSEYKTYSKVQWAYHSTIVPNLLSEKYPDLIHVENKTFVRPNYTQLRLLFEMNFDWSKNYAIHLYIRFYKFIHDFNDIRYLNTTIGSVARHVLYGSKELCANSIN
ncbi:uncharacterized protein LOC143058747 [Mytilus galloprovincialis]|uniref:uncharacterized protein LOC143058747 n=1 Tax=Mytilus galloprovincialis TaxID=29158 RepID=UPI003F7CC9F6